MKVLKIHENQQDGRGVGKCPKTLNLQEIYRTATKGESLECFTSCFLTVYHIPCHTTRNYYLISQLKDFFNEE